MPMTPGLDGASVPSMSPTPSAPPPELDPRPVSGRFVAAYTAAQIGAFIGFIPLLTLLLPLKAAAISPAGKAELLAMVALWGAVTAGIANVVAGVLSDRARQGTGGRWRWMATGLAATVTSYGLIAMAKTPWALLAAVVALQISLNLMLNPLAAVLPDEVPDSQKGVVSGFAGLAYPVSSLFGALVIGIVLATEPARLWVVVGTMLVLVVPFILVARQRKATSFVSSSPAWSWVALKDHDFRMAFLSRLLVQTAVAMNVLYLLFFLQRETGIASVMPGQRPEAVVGWILAASTAAAILAGLWAGMASDRSGRRRALIFTGGLCLAAGALMMAIRPEWPAPALAQIVFGVGVGIYGVVDTALIAQVLPSRENAGRDLGLMNVATTAAQVLAPLLALGALQLVGHDLRLLFALSGVIAIMGATTILTIKRVR
ncbi:MAG: MFS transporter [Caulobacteraceae bacterium]|jgi:MFS family permease|nr:MFS transporter [Caulobacteraceae bacterium]